MTPSIEWQARHAVKNATFMARFSTHPDSLAYLRHILEQIIVTYIARQDQFAAEIVRQAAIMLDGLESMDGN